MSGQIVKNFQKISIETILVRLSAEIAAIWLFYIFSLFLRDILLLMGKTAILSPQQ